jgi:hypothetical protein
MFELYDGTQVWEMYFGSSGLCLNIREKEGPGGGDAIDFMHICDLPAFVQELSDFLESPRYQREIAKWELEPH